MKLKIKHYRIYRGLSVKALSKRIGISAGYISDIENNKKICSLPMLELIAMALDVCIRDLIECSNLTCTCHTKEE